jgi:hypothetical protein
MHILLYFTLLTHCFLINGAIQPLSCNKVGLQLGNNSRAPGLYYIHEYSTRTVAFLVSGWKFDVSPQSGVRANSPAAGTVPAGATRLDLRVKTSKDCLACNCHADNSESRTSTWQTLQACTCWSRTRNLSHPLRVGESTWWAFQPFSKVKALLAG